MEDLRAQLGAEQFRRVLKATPNGEYYILKFDLEPPYAPRGQSEDMTKDEVRGMLRNEGHSEDAIDSVLREAREGKAPSLPRSKA
jgi:hypothetical protein